MGGLGFVDAHVHFLSWALAQTMLRLEACANAADVVRSVAAAIDSLEPGEWLLGRGWREGDWSGDVAPHRALLDAVAPNHPVALTAKVGHSLWVNTKALEHGGL